MWMVRCDGGRVYEEFRARRIAAIGWVELGDVKPGASRGDVVAKFEARRPDLKKDTILSGASQVWRFINQIQRGDHVITYSPSARKYLVGRITGDFTVDRSLDELRMSLTRPTEWIGEIDRDLLTTTSRNSLGSVLTVFAVPAPVAADVLSRLGGSPVAPEEISTETDLYGLREDVEARAMEFIKDKLSALSWEEMQDLVAGILRAMGYKTRVSPSGPDRGKDIVASPDGFGFETPRIVVEVKHRTGSMGSKEVRGSLGGRHTEDRGLYVSTGGFTRDAYYEAERASIPLTLWDLDDLVRALVENYDPMDMDTKSMIPLKRIYWPA